MPSRWVRGAVWLTSAWFIIELSRGGIPWTPGFLASCSVLALFWVESDGLPWEKYPVWTVFFAALAAYLSTFRWHGGDDISNSLLPFALLKYGTFYLDPVASPWLNGKPDFTLIYNGHQLSFYPVAPGLLALPVYIIPILTKAPISEVFLHNLSKVSASLITAASTAIFYLAVSRRCSRRWAYSLTLLYGAGSWAFSVSSQSLWQHGPSQLGAALGLLGLEVGQFNGDLLCGFGWALGVASRPDTVFYCAAVGVFFLFSHPRRLKGFLLGGLGPLILLLSYWFYYTGRLRPPDLGAQHGMFTGFQPRAFFGLILSPTRGIFLFFPAAVFGVWAALRKDRNPAGLWLLAACVGTWLFLSYYAPWVGGNSFGTRYFAVTAMILAYLCVDAEKGIVKNPTVLAAWCGAVSVSVIVHTLGAFMTWPGSNGVRYELQALWDWRLYPLADLWTATGSLSALPAFGRALVGLGVIGCCGWLGQRLYCALSPR